MTSITTILLRMLDVSSVLLVSLLSLSSNKGVVLLVLSSISKSKLIVSMEQCLTLDVQTMYHQSLQLIVLKHLMLLNARTALILIHLIPTNLTLLPQEEVVKLVKLKKKRQAMDGR